MRHPERRFMLFGLTMLSSICLPLTLMEAANETPNVPITLEHIGTKMKPKRPKAPDRQVVTCAYDGDELHLTFAYSEGMATISVTDESLMPSTYALDTSLQEITVIVGHLEGKVSIEIETELGNIYIGDIA